MRRKSVGKKEKEMNLGRKIGKNKPTIKTEETLELGGFVSVQTKCMSQCVRLYKNKIVYIIYILSGELIYEIIWKSFSFRERVARLFVGLIIKIWGKKIAKKGGLENG